MSLWGNKETAAVTGTVSITNGTAAMTGTSTLFTTELKPGSFVIVGGVKYKVLSIASNTALTLTSNLEGSTVTGGTITARLAPTHLSLPDARKAVFVDKTEADVKANKDKGITGAGWWIVNTYTDSSGAPRSKAECLVSMTVASETSGDVEDLITADAQVTVTIGTAPANQTIASARTATFTVSATATSGNLTYQWQTAAAGATRFSNIGAATSSSLALSTLVAGDAGKQYRVVVATDNGAAKVISSAATLAYTQPSISVQPTNQNIVLGAATVTVTASGGSGTVAYQWQTAPAGSTTFTNAGTNSASLALTGQVSGDTGKQVRVIVSNNSDGTAVTSSIATLTFVSSAS
jgi:hypothetical protein